MQWDKAKKHRFKSGDFYLGKEKNIDIGVSSERHAITIAGAGSGKGATCIIPNIKRWPHNLLVIDPKGENAKATVNDRSKKGQNVYVIDPFMRSGVDEKYITNFNPIELLDIHSMTIAEDIKAIADGIVMRSGDSSAENWDDGAATLIAGVIGFVLLEGEEKNLGEVRDIISEQELINGYAEQCKNDNRLGGILKAGAGRVLAKEGAYYVSNADKNTAWIDSEPVKKCLSKSYFSLSELKNGNASVYLCLPANYVASHARLLRMFVRCAIEEMARPTLQGKDKNKQCLFMLDEFFALGFINEIAVSSGLMRGYGLQLWPILQDLGQLISLYGQEGAQTFFANADLHQFFGVSDNLTASIVSEKLGVVGVNELPPPPKMPTAKQASMGLNAGGIVSSMASGSKDNHMRMTGAMLGGALSMGSGLKASAINADNQHKQAQYQNEMNEYNRAMSTAGRPRVPPDEVMALTQKNEGIVAEHSINFIKGAKVLLLKPQPYFSSSSASKNWNIFNRFDGASHWEIVLTVALGGVLFRDFYNGELHWSIVLGMTAVNLLLAIWVYSAIKKRVFPHVANYKWTMVGFKALAGYLIIQLFTRAVTDQNILDILGIT